MAVIARGNGMMTRFLPAIVLLVHDVAVHADLGVFGKIGKRFGRPNEVAAKANERAQEDAQYQLDVTNRDHIKKAVVNFQIAGRSEVR